MAAILPATSPGANGMWCPSRRSSRCGTPCAGTALVQKRLGGDAITVVTGGDAGSAEGDFASCLIWSTRPGNELPVLIVVQNNGWGISTPGESVHAEKRIIDRGKAFGIPGEVVDGNDPIASWHAIRRAMACAAVERRPFLLEARLSRLYGHSSSSGAIRVKDEPDCIELFEHKLIDSGVADQDALDRVHEEARVETEEVLDKVSPASPSRRRRTWSDSPTPRARWMRSIRGITRDYPFSRRPLAAESPPRGRRLNDIR